MARVAIVTPFFPPHIGGMERALERIAIALAVAGHVVDIHTSAVGPQAGAIRTSRMYRVHSVGNRLGEWATAARRWACEAQLDRLLVASFGPDTRVQMGGLVSELQSGGVRTVWRSPTADHASRNLSGGFADLLQGVDVIVANSAASASRTAEVVQRPVEVVPNLVLDDELQQAEKDSRCARACDVAWVGRVSRRKRPAELLALMERITEAGFSVHVQATPGYGENELFGRFVSDLPVDVVRHPAAWRQPAVVRRAGVFIHLSEVEGSPNSVLEAALRGSIPLTSDLPECRELLEGTLGEFLSIGTGDIAAVIERLMEATTLPKDVAGILRAASASGLDLPLLSAVESINGETRRGAGER